MGPELVFRWTHWRLARHATWRIRYDPTFDVAGYYIWALFLPCLGSHCGCSNVLLPDPTNNISGSSCFCRGPRPQTAHCTPRKIDLGLMDAVTCVWCSGIIKWNELHRRRSLIPCCDVFHGRERDIKAFGGTRKWHLSVTWPRPSQMSRGGGLGVWRMCRRERWRRPSGRCVAGVQGVRHPEPSCRRWAPLNRVISNEQRDNRGADKLLRENHYS